ncbi:MAG: hypothetical protein HFJ66_01555 [Eggerthellaceae bacterium]|nr:hypothetical protein [Eggerthellaceae bacterium]
MEKTAKTPKVIRGLFLAAFLGFVFSILLAKGATVLGFSAALPDWAVQSQTNSVLEGRKYQQFPKLSLSTFVDGDFQGKFEQYVSDLVPNRDDVIMTNAAFQRGAINASASLVGFKYAPTYFGSESVYDSDHDAIMPFPEKKNSDIALQLPRAVEALNGFVARHPGIDVVFANVDRLEFSDLNPLDEFVSNPIDGQYIDDAFLEKLSDAIEVVQVTPQDADTFFADYFRSDHHWNTPGAYAAYETCLEALRPGDSPVEILGEVVFEDIPFFGSRTRSALAETARADKLIDYIYDESDLVVDYSGVGDLEKLRHRDLYGSDEYSKRPYANHYADYFHGDPGIFTIENPNASNGDTLLIVGDSYTNAVERFFAEHYAKVVVVDPRHLDMPLDDVVDQYKPGEVLFLMAGYTYTDDGALSVMEGQS